MLLLKCRNEMVIDTKMDLPSTIFRKKFNEKKTVCNTTKA